MVDKREEKTMTNELRALLDARNVEWHAWEYDDPYWEHTSWQVGIKRYTFAEYTSEEGVHKSYLAEEYVHNVIPEEVIAATIGNARVEQSVSATLGDEKQKKCCSTCQYRYVTGQRPYPTFGYMCGFGDGKGLCGDNRSVLNHMGCEHWEKELK